MKSHSLLFMFITSAAIILMAACAPAAPAPTATPTAVPPTPTLAPPVPAPTPVLTVGLKPGERFHDIHTSRLRLKCDFCHVRKVETYYDPLAQVFNLADRRACLSCHKEGGVQPFYGEEWSKAKVGR